MFENLKKYILKNNKNTNLENNEEKVFVVILLACFGDILVHNSLMQNIKALYPNSKTVFIVDKPWADIARYSKDVDDVCIYDKRGKYKGLLGMLRFAKDFKYKHIDYLLRFHPTERTRIVSHLLRPKKLISVTINPEISMQENAANILKNITDKEIHNYPIKFCYEGKLPDKFKEIFKKDKKYVAFCTTTKLVEKDMPIDTAVELINKLNEANYEVVYIGAGQKAKDHAEQFLDKNCKFINLVNQTTLTELALILKSCNALISVDTGTMHYGYSMSVPTVGIFYKKDLVKLWAPDENLYNVKVLSDDITPQNIYEKLELVLNK